MMFLLIIMMVDMILIEFILFMVVSIISITTGYLMAAKKLQQKLLISYLI